MDNDTGKHWWYCLTHHEVEGDDGCPARTGSARTPPGRKPVMLWNSSRNGTGSGMRGAATTSDAASGCPRLPPASRGPGLTLATWQSIVG